MWSEDADSAGRRTRPAGTIACTAAIRKRRCPPAESGGGDSEGSAGLSQGKPPIPLITAQNYLNLAFTFECGPMAVLPAPGLPLPSCNRGSFAHATGVTRRVRYYSYARKEVA